MREVLREERHVVLHFVERLGDRTSILRERLLDAQPTGERRDHDLFIGRAAVLHHFARGFEDRHTIQGAQVRVIECENDAPWGVLCRGRTPLSWSGHRRGPAHRPTGTLDVQCIGGYSLAPDQDLEVVDGQIRYGSALRVGDDRIE